MTKIDIISGFLGAGKTTLIKKLIKEALQGEKLVLIENEFGEIGIDGGFLQESGIQITEMNSGCICCSLVGDFGTALEEVLNTYNPDRVIIEPSGVGKLSDVIKAVEEIIEKNNITLNSYTTIVDAKKCKMYIKNFGEFFNNQVQYAKTIILSRTNDISNEKIQQCIDIIKEINSNALLITTPWDDLDGKMILEEMEKKLSLEYKLFGEEKCDICGHLHTHSNEESEHGHNHEDNEYKHSHEECEHKHNHGDSEHEHTDECVCGHEHHDHHADEVFMSWGIETHQKYLNEGLTKILETLIETDEYGIILRAKGMLPNKDGKWMYFDLVPGEYEIREGIPQVIGRICIIGSNLNQDKLAVLFK